MTVPNPVIRESALRYLWAGLSVLPVRADGSKAPALPSWKEYQTRLPTEEEVRLWFGNGLRGVAVVAGAVSGNLAVMDFDDDSSWFAFMDACNEHGGTYNLPAARTPAGHHLYFRSPEPLATQVLARDEAGNTLVEIRAEGAYAIVPPSPAEVHPDRKPYVMIRGDLTDVPLLSAEQVEDLLALARSLDRKPEQHTVRVTGEAKRVGDRFNEQADVLALLQQHGWAIVGQRGANVYLRRPGKHAGVSATWHEELRTFYCFSTNAPPFRAGEAYSAFACYALLEHAGDFTAAARALAEEYGTTVANRNGQKPEGDVEAEKTYRHLLHLREMFAGRFRWCPEWKTWLQWNGTIWERVPQEAVVATATEELREFYARQVADAPTHGGAEKWTKRLLDLFGTGHVQDAVELLRGYPEFLTYAAEFDRDPYLLNCRNGILDLRTLQLRPHNPDALCTRVVNAQYDPNAEAPRWEQFLHQIFAGDTELVRFMQRACGMSLIGENRHHLLFILHGTGANGKSTFLHAVRHVFGSYGGAIPRDALLARRHQQDAARTAYSVLVGMRFATLEELSDEVTLSVVAVKDLTSGNPMQVRALYENYREVKLGLTPFVATNSKPSIHEHTDGTWRRLRLVPFNVVIPPERRDPDLGAKLAQEADGILRWLVDGLRDYWEHGLQEPTAVVEATREYRSEQDVLEAFLNECCEVSPRALTPSAELYEAYRQWALAQGEREEELLSERAFGQRLTKRGFSTARGTDAKRTRLRRGLRLKSDVSDVSDVSTEKSVRESDYRELFENNVRNVQNVQCSPVLEGENRRATPLGVACRAIEQALRGGREATKEELRRATRLPPQVLQEAIAHLLGTGELRAVGGHYRRVEVMDDG